jgi:hypothetical protein
MPYSNPITDNELKDLALNNPLHPRDGSAPGQYMPPAYFMVPPATQAGLVKWRLFDAAYISTGIIDPNRLGTGAVGDGNLYLADDGTWKPVSGGGGGGAVDRIIAGTNISISPLSGTGDVTINATTLVPDPTGYGSFFSSQTQPLAGIDTPQVVTFNNTYEANDVYISSNRIYFNKAGTYQFAYVAQIFNIANSIEHCSFWIKYNGVDFPNSSTHITVQPRKSSTEPSEQQMKLILSGTAQNDGDYIELYWQGTSTDLSLGYVASAPGEAPVNSPSVIANIIPIGAQGRDSNLNELNDVLITSPVNNQLLRYNSGIWENWTPNFLTSVPTLDQVTTAGNSTTNAITVGGLNSINKDIGTNLHLYTKPSFIQDGSSIVYAKNLSGQKGSFSGVVVDNVSGAFGGHFITSSASVYPDWLIGLSKNVGTWGDLFYMADSLAASVVLTLTKATKNVLIGTTTDSGYKLDVNGTGRFSNDLTVVGSIFSTQRARLNTSFDDPYFSTPLYVAGSFASNVNSDDVVGVFASKETVTTSDLQLQLRVKGNTNAALRGTGIQSYDFLSSNVANFYINHIGGFVGIGTDVPNYTLDVNGTAYLNDSFTGNQLKVDNVNVQIKYNNLSTYTFANGLALTFIPNGYGLSINNYYFTDEGTHLALSYTATQNLVMTTGGNIGIGTTTPAYKLDVTGTIRATVNVLANYVYAYNGLSINQGADLRSTDGIVGWRIRDSFGTAYLYNNSGPFLFHTTQFNIRSTGSVTHFSSDSTYTRIWGSSNTPLQINRTANLNAGIRFGNTGSNSSTLYGGSDSYALRYFYNSSEFLTISTGGNVGINNSSPTTKLYIQGGSANWSETTQGTSIGTIHLDPENTGDNFGNAITFGASDWSDGNNAQAGIYVRSDASYGTKMYFATTNSYVTGSQTRMMIDHLGNIGMGVTSPVEKLDIAGRIKLNYGNYGWIYALDTNHSIIIRGNRDGVATDYTNYYQWGGTLAQGRGHLFWTGGALASQTLKLQIANDGIYMAGNVGIGTSSPSYKLHLAGGSQYIVGGLGGGNSSVYSSANRLIFDNDYNDSSRGPNKITLFDGSWLAGFGIQTSAVTYYSGENHRWYQATTATNAVHLMTLSGTGSLGIGTTSPLEKLHVAGANRMLIGDVVSPAADAHTRLIIHTTTNQANIVLDPRPTSGDPYYRMKIGINVDSNGSLFIEQDGGKQWELFGGGGSTKLTSWSPHAFSL